MLTLTKLPPLQELLELSKDYSAEQWLEAQAIMRPLVVFQEYPDITLVALTGVYLPPHERTILNVMHRGAGETVIACSRGTAKTATACCLYPAYVAAVFKGRVGLTLSASGFRGGQFQMLDISRWLRGGWDSQSQIAPFFRAGIDRTPEPVNKSNNYWSIDFQSESRILTLPTKDHDGIRGTRAHDVYGDEANFFDKELADKVIRPMLNVKTDMRHGGAYAQKNRIFWVSTVDYSWRAFQETIQAARDSLARDIGAREALLAGDRVRYEELESTGLHGYGLVRFDYTDVMIRRNVITRTGTRYRVNYPDTEIPLTVDKTGIPLTVRGEDGRMRLDSGPVEYWMTYAMDKEGIERPLRDGSVDFASWRAEQRNITDTNNGDVYGHALVEAASCRGDRYIRSYTHMPEAWKKRYADEQLDYTPPVLWECRDPCVLGVDYAPSNDFCAFVVIRMGPLAEGDYDYFTHHGHTEWSNVIWAEQHRKMTAAEAAEKIRELFQRYALHFHNDPRVRERWEACRGIGLDVRGAGASIRDELALIEPNPEAGRYIMYDPLDADERIAAFEKDRAALPILDCIAASDMMNDRLVSYSKGQMEQGLLYLPKYLTEVERPPNSRERHIGYEAAKILSIQLQKLRQRPTKMYRSFYMEGDTEQDANKKDLWAAFIYACKQMRAHIIRKRQEDNTPPPMGARVARVGARATDRRKRAVGARE